MNPRSHRRLLILAAVLANVAFTALGSIFNYPDVLDEPAGQVLAAFRDHAGRVSAWFLAPGALRRAARADRDRRRPAVVAAGPCGSRCRSGSRRPSCRSSACCAGRSSCPATPPTRRASTGVAAAARDAFTTASDILGTAVGETARLPPHRGVDRCSSSSRSGGATPDAGSLLGAVSAVLVLAGVLSPLGPAGRSTPRTSPATCCGASGSLIFAAVLVRRGVRQPSRA